MDKKQLLKDTVKHIDIKSFDSAPIIDAMRDMSFTSRDTAAATDILQRMIKDTNCTIWLTLAGSTSAGGCMQVYVEMIKNNMIDAVVATGASIVDMDFFEALGFKHYKGSPLWMTNNCVRFILTGFMTPTLMRKSCRHAMKQPNTLPTVLNRALIPPVNLSKKWGVISPNIR